MIKGEHEVSCTKASSICLFLDSKVDTLPFNIFLIQQKLHKKAPSVLFFHFSQL